MANEKRPIPIGVDDFKEMREKKYCYVDKTLLISEILKGGSKVTLFTRPRRFGKTLNVSMLKYFLDCNLPSSAPLFKGLKIELEENGKYLQDMNRYPVFSISLKNLDFLSYESFSKKLNQRISREFEKHKYLLDSEYLSNPQKERFERILSEKATYIDLGVSLQFISDVFFAHHKIKPFLLIDEYDAPIHYAFLHGQYEECIRFMREFYSNALKDNENLNKAILTGILRVAKESIFSGLNNPNIATILNAKHADYFGLTETEVEALLEKYELSNYLPKIKQWYNGYQFANKTSIYNPWSILKWLDDPEHIFTSHWLNTSSNDLIRSLFLEHKEKLQNEVFQVLSGKSIQIQPSDDLQFPSLKMQCSVNDYFSLLLHSGYLTIQGQPHTDNYYDLVIPNVEIQGIFRKMVGEWLSLYAPNLAHNLSLVMTNSLKKQDLTTFQKHFSEIVMQIMSYHDFAKHPENAFHCFTAGFLSWLAHEYDVRSNRETGSGRSDIYLIPKNKTLAGYIFELKAYKPRKKTKTIPAATITKKLNEALKQIEENNYEVEFKARGIKKINKIAMLFYGKKVWFKAQ